MEKEKQDWIKELMKNQSQIMGFELNENEINIGLNNNSNYDLNDRINDGVSNQNYEMINDGVSNISTNTNENNSIDSDDNMSIYQKRRMERQRLRQEMADNMVKEIVVIDNSQPVFNEVFTDTTVNIDDKLNEVVVIDNNLEKLNEVVKFDEDCELITEVEELTWESIMEKERHSMQLVIDQYNLLTAGNTNSVDIGFKNVEYIG